MKRVLAILLIAVLMVTVLPGCNKSTKSSIGGEEKTVIKFWGHQNASWNASHGEMVKRFEAGNQEYKIDLQFFPYSDFESKIQTSLLSKSEGADIYELWGGWALDFTDTGALAKVPDNISSEFKKDFFDAALGAFELDGSYYGAPLEFNIEYGGLLVNKKLFEDKGLQYPKTWADMESIAEQTSVKDGEIMDMRGLGFVSGDNIMYTWMGMLMSKGADYFGTDGKLDFRAPEAVEAMERLVSYVKDKGYTNLAGVTGEDEYAFIYLDQAMQCIRGPWVIAEGSVSYELEYGVDFEYTALPLYGDSSTFAAETGWGLAVPESSKVKEGAWEYVEFFMQPENLIEHNIACVQIPPRQAIVDNPKYLEDLPFTKPLLEILPSGKFIGHFNTEVFKEGMQNLFIELCTTDKYASVEEGLIDLETKLNQDLFK